MKTIIKEKCCGCAACANACPKQCISMSKDAEGFLYPKADASQCVDCGICERVCPFNQKEPLRSHEPLCYAAMAKDEDIREKSSSGGVFSLIAKGFYASGGIVYGVAMDDDMKSCSMIRTSSADGLQKLRGSKYIQADVHDIYKAVKDDLEAGRQVLFSGVPCQIGALKLFLNKEYDNLYCVEVVCHGTPSPLLWKKYIDYLEKKYNGSVQSVGFRSKKTGWKKFSVAIDGNNFHQSKTLSEDPFLVMFLRNYCLRPSCYDCQAKKLASAADLTLADYWGIWITAPEMYDDKGTSLVMLQSDKGAELFERIKEFADHKETPFKEAVLYNAAYSKSCERPKQRDRFFDDLNTLPFDSVIKSYCSLSTKAKIKKLINKLSKRKAHH